MNSKLCSFLGLGLHTLICAYMYSICLCTHSPHQQTPITISLTHHQPLFYLHDSIFIAVPGHRQIVLNIFTKWWTSPTPLLPSTQSSLLLSPCFLIYQLLVGFCIPYQFVSLGPRLHVVECLCPSNKNGVCILKIKPPNWQWGWACCWGCSWCCYHY